MTIGGGEERLDIAHRLAMSEADLYRKQRLAIEEVARTLSEMEAGGSAADGSSLASSSKH